MLYILISIILIYMVFVDPKKNTILKSIIFGLFFGIIAYIFIPRSDYDLSRHQLYVKSFMNSGGLNYLIYKIRFHEYELIPTIYSFIIAKFNNVNLTQFFVVSLGYGTMYYLVSDYSKRINMNNLFRIVILMFTIFGFYVLYFISGLYFYIGAIIFSLAFYLDYYKKSNRLTVYLLYFLTIFIHDSMLFPLGILALYKLFKSNINIISMLVISFLIFFSYTILFHLTYTYSVDFLEPIFKMYSSYLSNGEYMIRLYRGNIFFIEISKIMVVLISTIILYVKENKNKYYNYIILMILSTLFMVTRSIVMIRFSMVIHLIGIVPLSNYFIEIKNKKNKLLMFVFLSVLSLYYLLYFIYILKQQTFNF